MEKLRYKLNVRRSPTDIRDWKACSIYSPIKLPEVVDYRPDMFPVRDQGDQGSCAAMAGSAMKELQEVEDFGIKDYMSPQFIYNNREGEDEGMYMRDLMKILQEKGDCFEALYPYGSTFAPSAKVYENAVNFVIKNYAAVESIDELKTALYLNGPCVIAVPVYNFTTRMWYQYSRDVFLGGHAMCVVGYNKEGFIIRNSWGSSWGDYGYCIFPYADWGLQWEVWTTIDEQSYKPEPPKPEPQDEETWLSKYWWVLAIGVAVVAGVLIAVL